MGTEMPDTTEKSFTDTFDDALLNAANTDQRPYIWCRKCNANNSNSNNINNKKCISYDVCKKNYASIKEIEDNKDKNKNDISDAIAAMYKDCSNVFPNYPKSKYLEINN